MFYLAHFGTDGPGLKRFRDEFPVGRKETSIVQAGLDKGYVLVEARVYREHEDNSPAAIDYAFGDKAFYNANMKRWFVEDTTSSAIGRAISLLTPGEHRSTAETMAQVVAASPERLDSDPWASVTITAEPSPQPLQVGLDLIQGALGGTITETGSQCAHGRMIWKEGISSKTGNKYKGWVCPSKEKPQCPPKWEKD